MGLESEFSLLQSMDDNLGVSGTKLNINGPYRVEDGDDKLLDEINTEGTAVVSSSVTVVSVEGNGSALLAVDKRRGLRKWRRIPREVAMKTRSCRSSAAVSDLGMCNEMSDLNGESSVLVDDHQRNGGIGPGKKARGVVIDEENLNSTMGIMGSDSRRSDFVFVQGGDTAVSKGRQSGMFARHEEESSDDKDLNEEAEAAFLRSDDESVSVSLAADSIWKHKGSMEQDPLVESIKELHFAQEVFEREMQKWRDVGKDDPLIFNDPMRDILELKDAKVLELEIALSSAGITTEVEDCLMKIVQADVEHVVITTTNKRLTEGPLREVKHNLRHKNVSSQDLQATKKQDGNLETDENVRKLQNRVCRFASCFMIQLMLLLVTLYLKFSPQSVVVVPT